MIDVQGNATLLPFQQNLHRTLPIAVARIHAHSREYINEMDVTPSSSFTS